MTTARTRVRFSPTPSRRCSLGLARTALLTNLLAASMGGEALLTSDDVVAAEGSLDADAELVNHLTWLGLSWSVTPWTRPAPSPPLVQSSRGATYAAAAERLLSSGAAYRCVCPPRARPGGGRCPCRGRPRREGVTAVRFRMPVTAGPAYTDFASGARRQVAPAPADPVLVRADGTPTSRLTYPADDVAYGVTLPILDRGRAGIDAYVAVSSALGGRIEAVVDLGRIVLVAPGTRCDIGSLRRRGVPAGRVRAVLLASLFGSWPGWLPTHPVDAAAWCDWSRLRRSVTRLDPATIGPARRSEGGTGGGAPPSGAPSVPAGDLDRRRAAVSTRVALLRRRSASDHDGNGSRHSGDRAAHAALVAACRLVEAGGDPEEVIGHLLSATRHLAFAPQVHADDVELLQQLCARCLAPAQGGKRAPGGEGVGPTAPSRSPMAVFVDGRARPALAVDGPCTAGAVLASLVHRGDLHCLPGDRDRVVFEPGRVVSVDRRAVARPERGERRGR